MESESGRVGGQRDVGRNSVCVREREREREKEKEREREREREREKEREREQRERGRERKRERERERAKRKREREEEGHDACGNSVKRHLHFARGMWHCGMRVYACPLMITHTSLACCCMNL